MNTPKLIDAKQRWAREGRLLVPAPAERQRLPPGQSLVRDWPVLDLGTRPNLRPADWTLSVGGLVRRPATLDWRALQRLHQAETVSDIHCVTAWSRYDNRWGGVLAAALLDHVGVAPPARFAVLRSFDSYATLVEVDDLRRPLSMLATHWDGAPLTREHGGPVRLILPHLYLWKSAKWIRHIWFTDKPARGYWEARGYHLRGDPWAQERYG